ncbi:hypothetical protein JHK82_027754 [Glycine max]|nr:hypothetical protein JHK82_027754 [Glycine max]
MLGHIYRWWNPSLFKHTGMHCLAQSERVSALLTQAIHVMHLNAVCRRYPCGGREPNTNPGILQKAWPRDCNVGTSLLPTLVSHNSPDQDETVSPWRIRFGFPLEKSLKVKETMPVKFALVGSTRKKARERERTI